MNTRRTRIAALVLAAGLPLSALAETMYTLTQTLVGFNAWAMNENGQIAGWGSADDFAKLYTPGAGIVDLPRPEGVVGSNGYTINEQGQVGGQLSYSGSYSGPTYQGFIYTPGPSGGMELKNERISIGWSLSEQGVAYELPGPFPDWSVFGVTTSTSGYAAGYASFNFNNDYGRAWSRNPDGTFSSIGLELGTPQSMAFGVNDSGVVVGRAIPDNYGATFAFSYIPDVGGINLFDATDPTSRFGWTRFVSAQDITSDGRIVGWGVYTGSNGYSSGLSSFVLTPVSSVPEPETYTMLLTGLGLLWVVARGRKLGKI